MSAQPEGSDWPLSGRLAGLEYYQPTHLAAYIHVPFCLRRCGYCDFNTYTTGFGLGADLQTYHQSIIREIHFAKEALAESFAGAPTAPNPAAPSLSIPNAAVSGFTPANPAASNFFAPGTAQGVPVTGVPVEPRSYPPLESVFFGGGTPSLLDPTQIGAILAALAEDFGLDPTAEVTLEANPDTLTPERIAQFQQAGITRLSLGMQSAVSGVLKILDRTHDQAAVAYAVEAAAELGLQTSVDLIYGTPGETLEDWRTSLAAATALNPTHISAYSLIIEEGTRLSRQVTSGKLAPIDPDEQAAKYELSCQLLEERGYHWYEISNFAKATPAELAAPIRTWRYASKHNLAYWQDWDWWGFGPGAHSHVGGYRWWNLKHPRVYADRIERQQSPAHQGEQLSETEILTEKIMLAIRTRDGLAHLDLDYLQGHLAHLPQTLERLHEEGLVEFASQNPVLTVKGRLLADYATRVLLEWD